MYRLSWSSATTATGGHTDAVPISALLKLNPCPCTAARLAPLDLLVLFSLPPLPCLHPPHISLSRPRHRRSYPPSPLVISHLLWYLFPRLPPLSYFVPRLLASLLSPTPTVIYLSLFLQPFPPCVTLLLPTLLPLFYMYLPFLLILIFPSFSPTVPRNPLPSP